MRRPRHAWRLVSGPFTQARHGGNYPEMVYYGLTVPRIGAQDRGRRAARGKDTMGASARIRRAIWIVLAAAMLCQPVSALAQVGPDSASDSGLDIALKDGRLTISVADAPLSRVLKSIAAKGGFALDIAGQLDSKVSASFESVPIKRALRRLVGRSSYVIELAPPSGAGQPRRIAKLSVFARGAPSRVDTSSTPRGKRGKASATKSRRTKRRGATDKPKSRRRPRSPSS